MTPTLQVTLGPAAIERLQGDDLVGGGEDGIAPLLGLDPGMGRPTVDGQAKVERALACADDVAVGARALEHQGHVRLERRRRMCGVLVGEPISSSGLAMKTRRLKGSHVSASAADRAQGGERVEAGQQAALHVGHAGAVGTAVRDAKRTGGGRARVEDGVHVADQERPTTARAAVEGGHDRVAQAPGRVRPTFDPRTEVGQGGRRPGRRPR